jgi:hypothetical protein
MIWARRLALGASTPWKRIRCSLGRGTSAAGVHEFQRRHDDVGGPILVRALELQYDLAGPIALEALVGNGGTGDIAAQVFKFFALMGGTTHLGM